MIDTYFDRCDAASDRNQTQPPIHEDPRYWGGQLYATVIDRMAAKARAVMRWEILANANNHLHEIRHGIACGSKDSIFNHQGRP